MSDYQVAIPSYHRPDTVVRKTLHTLFAAMVPYDRITVFVADDDEYDRYATSFQINDVPPEVRIIIGCPTLARQRSFIHGWYPTNQRLVSIDDDVTGFVHRYEDIDTGKPKLGKVRDLDTLFSSSLRVLKQHNLNLGGWYPVPNAMFMKPNITTDLRLIVGAAWFCINKNDATRTQLPFGDEKEDYQRTIQWYELDGGVMRINDYAALTKYYKEPGGMQDDRTWERSKAAVDGMIEKWPHYLRPKKSHKGTMFPEMALKDRRGK